MQLAKVCSQRHVCICLYVDLLFSDPPVPQFKITGHSSNQVNMTLSVKEGKVDKYTAIFENANKSKRCGEDYHTQVNAGFFSLESLTPGTKYSVYVESSIHSLTTKSKRQIFITGK